MPMALVISSAVKFIILAAAWLLLPAVSHALPIAHTPVPGGVAVIPLPEGTIPSSVHYDGKRVMTTGNAGSLHAIVGLPLGAEAGTHHLEAQTRGGETQRLAFEISDKAYETQTGVTSYSDRRDRRLDPYQKIFNDIANDLQLFAAQLPPKQLQQTRQVSELKFFADMSPLAYSEHLAEDEDGIATVVRLPAENDPTVARLRQIRERDRLVVDTLNEHYANFYYGIAIPYRNWRKVSRQESVAYRQVKRSATIQTLMGVVVVAGSLAVDTSNSSSSRQRRVNRGLQNLALSEGFNRVIGGIRRSTEADQHKLAIGELSESFGAQAAPMVVSVEGQERRLTGTAQAQYESWRRLLKEIYQAETGFTQTVDVGVPARANENSAP